MQLFQTLLDHGVKHGDTIEIELPKVLNLENMDINIFDEVNNDVVIDSCEKTIYMNLASNNIKNIPEYFCYFPQLRYLSLANNNIKVLPSYMENLHSLEILNVKQNPLLELPVTLSQLKKLQEINIEETEITMIPSDFKGYIEKDGVFILGDLPLHDPPKSEFDFSTDLTDVQKQCKIKNRLLAYWNAINKNKRNILSTAVPFALMGRTGAGKSTIVQSLLKGHPSRVIERTCCFSKPEYLYINNENASYKFNLIDLGGHECYGALYPFILGKGNNAEKLSTKSAFIIMVDAQEYYTQMSNNFHHKVHLVYDKHFGLWLDTALDIDPLGIIMKSLSHVDMLNHEQLEQVKKNISEAVKIHLESRIGGLKSEVSEVIRNHLSNLQNETEDFLDFGCIAKEAFDESPEEKQKFLNSLTEIKALMVKKVVETVTLKSNQYPEHWQDILDFLSNEKVQKSEALVSVRFLKERFKHHQKEMDDILDYLDRRKVIFLFPCKPDIVCPSPLHLLKICQSAVAHKMLENISEKWPEWKDKVKKTGNLPVTIIENYWSEHLDKNTLVTVEMVEIGENHIKQKHPSKTAQKKLPRSSKFKQQDASTLHQKNKEMMERARRLQTKKVPKYQPRIQQREWFELLNDILIKHFLCRIVEVPGSIPEHEKCFHLTHLLREDISNIECEQKWPQNYDHDQLTLEIEFGRFIPLGFLCRFFNVQLKAANEEQLVQWQGGCIGVQSEVTFLIQAVHFSNDPDKVDNYNMPSYGPYHFNESVIKPKIYVSVRGTRIDNEFMWKFLMNALKTLENLVTQFWRGCFMDINLCCPITIGWDHPAPAHARRSDFEYSQLQKKDESRVDSQNCSSCGLLDVELRHPPFIITPSIHVKENLGGNLYSGIYGKSGKKELVLVEKIKIEKEKDQVAVDRLDQCTTGLKNLSDAIFLRFLHFEQSYSSKEFHLAFHPRGCSLVKFVETVNYDDSQVKNLIQNLVNAFEYLDNHTSPPIDFHPNNIHILDEYCNKYLDPLEPFKPFEPLESCDASNPTLKVSVCFYKKDDAFLWNSRHTNIHSNEINPYKPGEIAFGFGTISYFLLSKGYHPHQSLEGKKLFELTDDEKMNLKDNIAEGTHMIKCVTKFSKIDMFALDLIQSCLEKDPLQRPMMSDLIHHPYIDKVCKNKDMDWNKDLIRQVSERLLIETASMHISSEMELKSRFNEKFYAQIIFDSSKCSMTGRSSLPNSFNLGSESNHKCMEGCGWMDPEYDVSYQLYAYQEQFNNPNRSRTQYETSSKERLLRFTRNSENHCEQFTPEIKAIFGKDSATKYFIKRFPALPLHLLYFSLVYMNDLEPLCGQLSFWSKKVQRYFPEEAANQERLQEAAKVMRDLPATSEKDEVDEIDEVYHFIFQVIDADSKDGIKTILDSNASQIDCKNDEGETPIIYALKKSKNEAATYLLTLKPDLSIHDKKKNYPIHLCIQSRNYHQSVLQDLISSMDDLNVKNGAGMTALMLAVKKEKQEIVEKLLEEGADPFITNQKGKIAADFAKESNNVRLVDVLETHFFKGKHIIITLKKILHDNPDYLNSRDSKNRVPLLAAIDSKSNNAAKWMIRKSNLALADDIGRTAIDTAAKKENYVVLGDLLEKKDSGVDINRSRLNGYTALMLAAENGEEDCVRLLLNNGAKKELTNEDGLCATELAENDYISQIIANFIHCDDLNSDSDDEPSLDFSKMFS